MATARRCRFCCGAGALGLECSRRALPFCLEQRVALDDGIVACGDVCFVAAQHRIPGLELFVKHADQDVLGPGQRLRTEQGLLAPAQRFRIEGPLEDRLHLVELEAPRQRLAGPGEQTAQVGRGERVTFDLAQRQNGGWDIGADGENAETVRVTEREGGIGRRQFLPQAPDAELGARAR